MVKPGIWRQNAGSTPPLFKKHGDDDGGWGKMTTEWRKGQRLTGMKNYQDGGYHAPPNRSRRNPIALDNSMTVDCIRKLAKLPGQ